MPPLSQEITDDILFHYKRTRSPFKVAKLVGLDTAVVWAVVDEHSDKLSAFPERNGGFGRPELTKYMVARRRVASNKWENDDAAIASARQAYEDGTHDMSTARDGGWLILYSMPLKRKNPRPSYFKPESF